MKKLRIISIITLSLILLSCNKNNNIDLNSNSGTDITENIQLIDIDDERVDISGEGEVKTDLGVVEQGDIKNTVVVKKVTTELEKEQLDKYNFEQLEIFKSTLDVLQKDSYVLNSYRDFNEKFEEQIEPIKNCYYITTDNGDSPYIFGFKLESEKYIEKYGTGYYSYPKYDIPVDRLCHGLCDIGEDCGGCIDKNYLTFKRVISNKCGGSISGYVYEDINKNNIFDIGEKGVEGFPVMQGIKIVLSDKDGYYSFGNLTGEDYEVKFTRTLKGYHSTDNDIKTINIENGKNVSDINFGVY